MMVSCFLDSSGVTPAELVAYLRADRWKCTATDLESSTWEKELVEVRIPVDPTPAEWDKVLSKAITKLAGEKHKCPCDILLELEAQC